MFNKIESLPDSPSNSLKLKDWLKGFGLVLLIFLSDSLPQIKEALTAHDFGDYNFAVKVLFFVVVWLIQRCVKNNVSK